MQPYSIMGVTRVTSGLSLRTCRQDFIFILNNDRDALSLLQVWEMLADQDRLSLIF